MARKKCCVCEYDRRKFDAYYAGFDEATFATDICGDPVIPKRRRSYREIKIERRPTLLEKEEEERQKVKRAWLEEEMEPYIERATIFSQGKEPFTEEQFEILRQRNKPRRRKSLF